MNNIIVENHDEHCHGCHDDESSSWGVLKIMIGAIILGAALIVSHFITINEYIRIFMFVVSYLILGGDVLLRAIKDIFRGSVFDENFLMAAATIGAFAIRDYPEAVAVMLFYQVGEYFQDCAVQKSKKSITKLMDIRPDYANLIIGNETTKVDPDIVNVGDIIMIKPGEKIPLDGIVLDGESMIDAKALTGESIPGKVRPSENVLSGCINLSGVLTVEVQKTYGESTVSKIIELVENASSKKAPTEKFITKFARYYTPIVVAMAVLLAIVPPLLFRGEWTEWVNKGLIFLVISCPCALVISIPLGFFGGIGGAAKRGILVKGGNYLEALSKIGVVVFDKTGTLTKGVFKVTQVIAANGYTEHEVLNIAALAETYSNHPIAQSILAGVQYNDYSKNDTGKHDDLNTARNLSSEALSEYKEIAGHGVSVKVGGKTVLAGNKKLLDSENIPVLESDAIGTHVYVAIDNVYVGCIVISDELKSDSHYAVTELKHKGVNKTVMLTGDESEIAARVAGELGIDEVYSSLLPVHKVEVLERVELSKPHNSTLVFVGDGINDAPVLARADVGIAMGGLGSDAAIEAADVVLMTDEPSKLIEAIDVSRFTNRVVRQNIVFAIVVKVLFLVLGAFGLASMWEAVFADVGVALLAVLNAMRIGRSSK